MNMKQYFLSLGNDNIIKLYREKGHDNLGQLITEITGKPCGTYGVMTGGILLDDETWRLLQSIQFEEWSKRRK